MTERYEFGNGRMVRFWVPWVHKNKLIVQHGRKYTEGRIDIKQFSSHDEAVHERTNLILKIIEKVHKKGYIVVLRSSVPRVSKKEGGKDGKAKFRKI